MNKKAADFLRTETRSPNCSVFARGKKALSPVVAMSLLLVVAVVSITTFQFWFQNYSGSLYIETEKQDSGIGTQVETMIGDKLYFNSKYNNITIDKVEIDGITCSNISGNYSKSLSTLNVSSCIESLDSGAKEIVVYTDKGIFSKELMYKKQPKPPVEKNHFVSVWNTSKPGTSSNNQITLPIDQYDGYYNFNVSWGDGTKSTITYGNHPDKTHTYSSPGVYQVNISGTIRGWYFDDSGDEEKIIEIKKWGPLVLQEGTYTSASYFHGASNLKITATDILNTTGMTDFSSMFQGATSITTISKIGEWNTSSVTDMSSMFLDASSFNGDLNSWDVTNVTRMDRMFSDASSFNSDLDSWNPSSVTNMYLMFSGAASFNGNISTWNPSSVTDMGSMFQDAYVFNHSLNNWNVSSVEDMSWMFENAQNFNHSLNDWEVNNVTDMSNMFSSAKSFNQPLNNWNVSSVEDMNRMFNDAAVFNQPLDSWDVSSVLNMGFMFYRASDYNQNLSSWEVSQVTSCSSFSGFVYSWSQPKPDFSTSSCSP